MNDIQICPLFSIHASLCASRAEMPAPSGRRGGPRGPDHLWVSFRSGVGWSALLIALADISKLHCNGLALLPKGVAPNNEHLKYKYACAFHNTKGCTWFALVYMAKQPQVPSSSRPTAHKDEPWQVFIPEDAPHSGHDQVQVRGPHRQFVAASKDRPEMLSMRPNEICAWLRNSANMSNLRMNVLALRSQTIKIKRFCYVARRALLVKSLPPEFRTMYLDSVPVLRSICNDYDFYNVFARLGTTFHAHTAFALPGWNPGLPSEEPGCAVVMFSTCLFLLDFIRLQRFYDTNGRRGVNLQIDHLFKVS